MIATVKTATTAIGTVGAALLAHIPCCGSSVLFAVGGVGASAGWLAALEPLRPWLIGFSVVSLAVGFWSAYRKPHACHSCGTCKSEAHAKRRVKIGSMWAVAAVSVGLILVGQINEATDHSGHAHAADSVR